MAKRGRPAFKPDDRQREYVEQLLSCGMSKDDCARALGITTPTLVKHFKKELTQGAATKRAEIVSLLFSMAREGNASCLRRLEEMTRPSVTSGATPSETGKKAQREAAAEKVGGKFSAPSPPRLVVNNG